MWRSPAAREPRHGDDHRRVRVGSPLGKSQSAGDPDDPDLDPGGECLLYTKGNVSVTPHQITLLQMMAQTVTVHWGVQVIIGTPAHPALDASTSTVVNAQDATVPEPD